MANLSNVQAMTSILDSEYLYYAVDQAVHTSITCVCTRSKDKIYIILFIINPSKILVAFLIYVKEVNP